MGTRCITSIMDGNRELVCMYRQFDGYPEGHGMELVEAFKSYIITNGISGGRELSNRTANGPGCLAGQVVAKFKTEIGGIYLYAPETREVGEEFVYTLSIKTDPARDRQKGDAIFEPKRIWLDVIEGQVAFFGLPGTKPELMDWLYSGWLDDFHPSKCGCVYHRNAAE